MFSSPGSVAVSLIRDRCAVRRLLSFLLFPGNVSQMEPDVVASVTVVGLDLRLRLSFVEDVVDDLLIGAHQSRRQHRFDAVRVLRRPAMHQNRLAYEETAAHPDEVREDYLLRKDVLVSPVHLTIGYRVVLEAGR